VPVTIVQQILGHASLSTTAMYLRYSASKTRRILKDRGVIYGFLEICSKKHLKFKRKMSRKLIYQPTQFLRF
jgi:hypothetical protein